MKVTTEGFNPITIKIETAQELSACVELLRTAWQNTGGGTPASDLTMEIAVAMAVDVD